MSDYVAGRLGKLKSGLVNTIKFNGRVREAYSTVGGLLLSLASVILPVKRNRAIFMSFGGRRFDDSPRAIYDAMVADHDFDDFELCWAFSGDTTPRDGRMRTVRVDSPMYFALALTSRLWVTNTSISRGMRFKPCRTISVNTWHGTPLKRMANYRHKEPVDILTSQNDVDERYFMRKFDTSKAAMLKCDLPRNDALLRYTDEDVRRIKRNLGLPEGKRVILYMPTFRDYQRDEYNSLFFTPPIDFGKWRRELQDKFVVLVRFHYMVEAAMEVPRDGFTYSVTDYPLLSDLYVAADIFVSDYSSSYVDYSILGRPMLCFGYDYEQYRDYRGFEVDFEEAIPCRIDRTEDEFLESIRTLDWEAARAATELFRDRFAPHAGHAAGAVVAEIKRKLGISD